MFNKTKEMFAPNDKPAGPPSGDPSCGIICFSTANFDAMQKFFTAIGFVVTESRDQMLLPIFSDGRGARVRRGTFEFNLEEDTSKRRLADFNMMLIDLSEEEINHAKNSGFKFTYAQSLYGESYTFTSPDGGTFVMS